MRRLLLSVLLIGSASAPVAQTMGIPDLCASVPSRTVIASGTTQTLTGSFSCVEVRGSLTLLGNVTAETIQVYDGGSFTLANGAQLTFSDAPIDLTNDPEQYGHGLIAVGGTIRMTGNAKTTYLRFAAEPIAGASTLWLESAPSGWLAGDELVIPDTRHLKWNEVGANFVSQIERRQIASVSGTMVTLTAPLIYDHLGARDAVGVLEFLPHVANTTRSIRVRSANPAGTRGHVLFTGRADVDLRNVEFDDLGRTTVDPLGPANQIGRYPVHFHHLTGLAGLPADVPQFRFAGNAVNHSRKWPVAVHDSHYGLVADNVIADWTGSGIMLEDGSETENVIERNILIGGTGYGGRQGEGREPSGIYARGPMSRIRNNVVSSVLNPTGADESYGYKYFLTYLGPIRVPSCKGCAPSEGQYTTLDGNAVPIVEFSDNEVYGATESGLTYWWIGAFGNFQPRATGISTLKNLRVWHVYNKGVFQYESSGVIIDGLTVRGKDASQSACCAVGFYGADYMSDGLIIRHADIQGMSGGIGLSSQSGLTPIRIEDSLLKNNGDIWFSTLYTSGYRADWMYERRVVIQNVRFGSATAISFDYNANPVRNLTQRDQIDVVDFNGVAGDSFRVYYAQQAPSFVVPQTILNSDGTPSVLGSPVAGLTNAQIWLQYGIAIAGEVAPCTTTRAGIVGGFACGAAPPPPPPPPAEICGDGIDNDGDGLVDEGCDSDGDGVPDSADLCPGTPLGTVVDATGCVPPPPDPCVTDPLVPTALTWPSLSRNGRWSASWAFNHSLASIQFLWSPDRVEAVDTRGCVYRAVK